VNSICKETQLIEPISICHLFSSFSFCYFLLILLSFFFFFFILVFIFFHLLHPPNFSQSAKIPRNNFSDPPKFWSGAKVWRINFTHPPRILSSAKIWRTDFSNPHNFDSLACFVSKKDMQKSQMQCPCERIGAKAKITKQSKVKKVMCVPLKLSENSFCKKNVKS
jgi:hypothetical protein